MRELRQFRDAVVPRRFSQGGWFDRSNDLAFRKIIDIVFIASLGPPGGGRQDMTARFVRPFNVVGADSASSLNFNLTLL